MALSESTMLRPGSAAPDVELSDNTGRLVSRIQFAGQAIAGHVNIHSLPLSHRYPPISIIGWQHQMETREQTTRLINVDSVENEFCVPRQVFCGITTIPNL